MQRWDEEDDMTELGFGQPRDGLIQLGFVVHDLDDAMARYAAAFGVPSWHVMRSFRGSEPRYLGAECAAAAHIAMGYTGHLQIELIQPADDEPSVHRHDPAAPVPGLHHVGVATTDFEASLAALTSGGQAVLFRDRPDPHTRVAYVDTRETIGVLTELIEASDTLDAMFTGIWRGSSPPPA